MHNGEHVEVQIIAPVAQPKTQTQTQTKSNIRPEVQALKTGTFTLKRKDVLCESRYVRCVFLYLLYVSVSLSCTLTLTPPSLTRLRVQGGRTQYGGG